MILHVPTGRPLRDFGIQVPIAPDRVGPVLQSLRSDSVLGPLEERWLIGPDDSSIDREDLLRVHTQRYVDEVFSDRIEDVIVRTFELVDADGNYHRYDPRSATRPLRELFDTSLPALAAGYQCGKEALRTGFCFYLGGGSHHAHPDFGHGFCIFNDSATAVRKLQADRRVETAWIIDVDVHKGDGTAAIMEGDNSVRTLSVHMAHGWPLDGAEFGADGNRHPSYTPSDIDIPVDAGEESDYNPRLSRGLDTIADYGQPDIAYVLAGADPYEKDGLESTRKLKLTLEQLNERNLMIYEFLKGLRIPQAWLMAGGYGDAAWEPYPSILRHVLRDRLG